MDLSNTMWIQRELINQLLGNACGIHGTALPVKYRDKHSTTYIYTYIYGGGEKSSCDLEASKQVRTPVELLLSLTNSPWERHELFYPLGYRLNSTTTFL